MVRRAVDFILSVQKRAATGSDVQRSSDERHQLKEGMDYLVVILTATLLATGAFVVYKTLPHDRQT
jgi:hypothetical protein